MLLLFCTRRARCFRSTECEDAFEGEGHERQGSQEGSEKALMRELRYRRSPWIVAYWTGDGIVFHNFATSATVAADALTIGLLDFFSSWKPATALVEQSTMAAKD